MKLFPEFCSPWNTFLLQENLLDIVIFSISTSFMMIGFLKQRNFHFSILTSSNLKNPLLNLVGFFHSLSFCLFTTNLNLQPYPKPLKLLQWFKGFISLLLNSLENKYLVQLNLSLPRYQEQLFTTTKLWSYKPKKLLQTIPKII